MNLVLRTAFRFFLVFTTLTCIVASQSVRATPQDQNKTKSSKHVNVKYDKSKNITTVTLKSVSLTGLSQERQQTPNIPTHQADMEAYFTYSGQQMTKAVETVTLRFRIVSGNYFILREQTVVAALDKDDKDKGRAIQLGTAKYSSDIKFNSVYEEYLTVEVPAEALRRVAAANTIELYLGPIGYELKEKQREALRDLVSRLTP